MGSQDIETREAQKARFVRQLEARKEQLIGKGAGEGAVAKDPSVKHLNSRIKQVDGALARIKFLQDQTQKLKEKKEEAKARAEAERAEMISGKPKEKKQKVKEEKAAAKGKGQKKAPAKAPANKGGAKKKK